MHNENTPTNDTARGGSGQAKYVITKDGFGNEVRHLNFDNEEVCKREGIIQLVPLKTTSRHQNNVGFRSIWDRKNQAMIGIPLHIDEQSKKWVYQKINLIDSETFDLSNREDAMKWAVVQHCQFLEGSPNLKDKPIYKVVDKEREAALRLAKRSIKRNAERIAEGLFGAQLFDMARSIGISPEQNSITTLSDAVITFAETNSVKFMEIWDSPTRKELFIIKRAIAVGIIEQDPMNGFMYGGISLGATEPIAVQFLRDNQNISNAIDSLTAAKEQSSEKSMKRDTESAKIEDAKDAVIAKLQAEMAALKEYNEKISKKELTDMLSKDVVKTINDPEHEELINEAKALGIKGYALMKKETLAAKVKEAKS
jgi:hypothetical protein